MRPLDFYIENIVQEYKCRKCRAILESMEEVKEHCTEQHCDSNE